MKSTKKMPIREHARFVGLALIDWAATAKTGSYGAITTAANSLSGGSVAPVKIGQALRALDNILSMKGLPSLWCLAHIEGNDAEAFSKAIVDRHGSLPAGRALVGGYDWTEFAQFLSTPGVLDDVSLDGLYLPGYTPPPTADGKKPYGKRVTANEAAALDAVLKAIRNVETLID